MVSGFSTHPLASIPSVDTLLTLPYFDILACLSKESLHPGGGVATQVLLDACRLQSTDRVLEIGCGPGWTTRALLRAGISVTVVERSKRMIDAMLYRCAEEGLCPPTWFQSPIERFTTPETLRPFNVALLECVVGFVADRSQIAPAITETIAPGGCVGVLDVHYTSDPPASVLSNLAIVTGHQITPLVRDDWFKLFPGMRCRTFQNFQLPSTSGDSGQRMVERSGIAQHLSTTQSELDRLVGYLDCMRAVFDQNKRYMEGHVAVFEVVR